MNKIKHTAVFLVIVVVFTACASEPDQAVKDYNSTGNSNSGVLGILDVEPEKLEESKVAADETDATDKPKNTLPTEKEKRVSLDKPGESEKQAAKPIERKIIRNASLQLESASPEDAQKKVTSIAEDKNGFVVQSRKSASGVHRGGDTVTMTIRIPADKFSETLDEIRKTGDRLIDESITGRDVTEEFIDIEARLKTKKALEERFLEIMKQSRSVKDALNVQRELANVRGEIERIEGRKRFLENQSSLSTIKVSIKTPTLISGSSSGFFYDLKEAVSDGFGAALGFVLVLTRVVIAVIPFLLLVVLPVFLVLRYFWRNSKRRWFAKGIVEEEIKDDIIDE